MKIFHTLLLIVGCSVIVFAQDGGERSLIHWYSIAEAEQLQTESPKTILVDMYTDWCGWCKKMDRETFANPSIADYINRNFYPVKLNAETTDTIVYRGKVYVNAGESGGGRRPTHQLAQLLAGGRMSYPTLIYIDHNWHANPVPGYVTASTIEPILIFFTERIHEICSFDDFHREFRNTFMPDSTSQISGNVKWLSIGKALEMQKEKPKKLLVYFRSEFVNGSKIMAGSVFHHPVIADYINEHYYPVKFDFDSMDTVKIGGATLINEKNTLGYPHQFTIVVLQPEIRLPSVAFFTDDAKLIFALRGFATPEMLERYLSFISDDLYKDPTQDFNKYYREYPSQIQYQK